MSYYFVLPSGTEIQFPECPHNNKVAEEGGLQDVTPGKIYTVDGVDRDGDCYFIDDVGEKN